MKKAAVCVMLAAVLLAGCKGAAPDHLVAKNPENAEGMQGGIEITLGPGLVDFELVNAQLQDEWTDLEIYGYVMDVSVEIDDCGKLFTMTATVADTTEPEVALDFADTMVRRVSYLAAMQSSELSPPTQDSFGSVYDIYTALICIVPASAESRQDWLVYDGIINSRVKNFKLGVNYQ